MNKCSHRICRTTAPCRYGNPDAPERDHGMDQAHAEALAENEAHDAAAAVAQPLTVEYLTRYADPIPPMPRRLRNQLQARSILSLVVPRGRQA